MANVQQFFKNNNHMNSNTTKYFLYARKSSEAEDRQVASIDSQINELNKIAKDQGLEIIETLSESCSAKAPGRPVFNQMLKRIKNGEANGIICWKLNRLARNPIDGGEISWILQQNLINHICTYGRSYYPTDNVIVMAVELGMANQFVRDLSVDTARGLRAKAERGWYPTFTTLGYSHNPMRKKGEKEIIIDQERFDLTRRMFDLMLTGSHPVRKILETATEKWGLRNKIGKKVALSTLYRIFSDPFYYGMFEYPKNSDNWYKGKHQPMITIEEYDKIQAMLGAKGNTRPKTKEFAFTGLFRCGECGARITAEEKIKKQKNGLTRYYTYYHCTKRKNPNCTQKSLRVENVEEQISSLLKNINLPREFTEWALEAIKEENKTDLNTNKKINRKHQIEYDECLDKINGLIDMRANKELTQEEFQDRKSDLTKKKIYLQELINDGDKRADDWINKVEKMINFAETAVTEFKDGNLIKKKEIVFALGSNLLIKDGIIDISLEKPLLLAKEGLELINDINKGLEPVIFTQYNTKLRDIYSRSPMMLPTSDSNLKIEGFQGVSDDFL